MERLTLGHIFIILLSLKEKSPILYVSILNNKNLLNKDY